jgi:hypothetical protein
MGENYEAEEKYKTMQTGTAVKKVLKIFQIFQWGKTFGRIRIRIGIKTGSCIRIKMMPIQTTKEAKSLFRRLTNTVHIHKAWSTQCRSKKLYLTTKRSIAWTLANAYTVYKD